MGANNSLCSAFILVTLAMGILYFFKARYCAAYANAISTKMQLGNTLCFKSRYAADRELDHRKLPQIGEQTCGNAITGQ
ncbi:hypothetical protein GCM10025776_33620 [Corallincola platygyrae]